MRVGIVGCGLIGKGRAEIVRRFPGDELVIVDDVDEARARAVAREMSCLATADWQETVCREDVDVVAVCNPNNYLMPVSVADLEHGKHLLCEKPPGCNFT